jgi:hypothetical protein
VVFSRNDNADCSGSRWPRRIRTLGSGRKPCGGIEALGPCLGMEDVASVWMLLMRPCMTPTGHFAPVLHNSRKIWLS